MYEIYKRLLIQPYRRFFLLISRLSLFYTFHDSDFKFIRIVQTGQTIAVMAEHEKHIVETERLILQQLSAEEHLNDYHLLWSSPEAVQWSYVSEIFSTATP